MQKVAHEKTGIPVGSDIPDKLKEVCLTDPSFLIHLVTPDSWTRSIGPKKGNVKTSIKRIRNNVAGLSMENYFIFLCKLLFASWGFLI